MTIRTEIDAAIDAACARGVGTAAMRLRLGPSALYALAADLKGEGFLPSEDELPEVYETIPIERVGAPGTGFDAKPTADAFHGWELIA